MKQFINKYIKATALMVAFIAVLSNTAVIFVNAAYEDNVNYMALMMEAATSGDFTAGYDAEIKRNEKIDFLGLTVTKIGFDELYYSSKMAQAEAGNVPGDAGDQTCQRIIEVAVNRVASPEFPDTMYDVIYQSGAYYVGLSAWKLRYFENTQPSLRLVSIALRVLEGERVLTPDVVYHGNYPMYGGSACSVYMGKGWGTMHFSYSSNRSLYYN